MFFDEIPEALPDPIFGKLAIFSQDPRPDKINLMIGVYKNDRLENHFLSSVRKAASKIDESATYLPIDGNPEYLFHLGKLVFGEKLWKSHQSLIYSAQTVGGTCALRVGAELLKKQIGKKIFLPSPTWANHSSIFENSGLNVSSLPYYNLKMHGFDKAAYIHSLEQLEPKSIVLLHASCHNPTGIDPSFEDWKIIAQICKKRNLIPFFDFAYQGFGEGIGEDAKALRHFIEEGLECLIAYSCSKNFGLYCQRVGALFIVSSNSNATPKVASQIKKIIRAMYSNPPSYGSSLVLNILQNPTLELEWKNELSQMRERIISLRMQLLQKFQTFSKESLFEFIRHHKGMFSYLDLNEAQVTQLKDQYGVYTLANGRINIAGLHPHNIDKVASSIIAVSAS